MTDLLTHYQGIAAAVCIVAFWATVFAIKAAMNRHAKPAVPCKCCAAPTTSSDGLCATCWWDDGSQ